MENLKLNKLKTAGGLLLLSIAIIFSGCSNNTGNPVNSTGSQSDMSVSIKADNSANNPSSVIVIDDAKALITEVEFEKEGTAENEGVHIDPFVIHFKTDGTIGELTNATIKAGTFTKIKFKIHKPDDNEVLTDPEFREGSGGNQRFSFIIKGTIDGNPFVFKSKQSASIVINLDNNISLNSLNKNVTVLFNTKWFDVNGVTIDPRDPGNENDIDNNLHGSFNRAFEDNDKNGVPDGH
jgi:hypothetical protein